MRRIFCALLMAACSGEATVVTYNVGLARGFVPYADERLDAAAEAIAGIDADAVCIQEAWLRQNDSFNWTTEYIDKLVDASSDSFPYATWQRTQNKGEATSCTPEEAAVLEECALEYCGDVSQGELADCALTNCGDLFNASSVGCQSCVAANIGNPIEIIMETCVGGSGSAAYDGHNGLLLLTKKQPETTNHIQFPSALTTRSALHAKVKVGGLGSADLFCTHLAADLSNILAYPGTEFGSYVEEQSAQIDLLLGFVEDNATTEHTIVMGDMNTGTDDIPENYGRFDDAGYSNQYVMDFDDSQCTYCSANTLNGGSGDGGVTIDHILTKTSATPVETDRILDETQAITTSEGPTQHHLSDHYGVRLTLER